MFKWPFLSTCHIHAPRMPVPALYRRTLRCRVVWKWLPRQQLLPRKRLQLLFDRDTSKCFEKDITPQQSRPHAAARRLYGAARSPVQSSRRPHAAARRCSPSLRPSPPLFAVHNAPTPPQRRRRAALEPPSRRSTPSRRPRAPREQAHPAAANDFFFLGGGWAGAGRPGPGWGWSGGTGWGQGRGAAGRVGPGGVGGRRGPGGGAGRAGWGPTGCGGGAGGLAFEGGIFFEWF